MKRRHLIGTIVLCAASAFTVPGYARGIRADISGNWSCPSVSPSSIWVTMSAGSPATKATLEPGLSTPASSLCTPDVGGLDDFGISGVPGPFTIAESGSHIFNWADGIQVTDYTLDPSAPSNQSGNDNLLGNLNAANYGGDSEIQFNYLSSGGTTCLVGSTTLAYEPEFTIGGTTYGNTQTPAQLCNPNSTSDMLFNGTTLVGYIDLSGNVQSGLAPGWSVVRSTPTVPEPGTVGMLALGLAATAFVRRKRAS